MRAHIARNIPLAIPLAPKQRSAPLVLQQPFGRLLDCNRKLPKGYWIALLGKRVYIGVILRWRNDIERGKRFGGTSADPEGISAPEKLRDIPLEEPVNVWHGQKNNHHRRHIQATHQHRPSIHGQPQPSPLAEVANEIGPYS